MRLGRHTFLVFALLCLLMLVVASGVYGDDEKRVMIAFTAYTQGEINPCG
jgi:hypothetical protein